ncbi:MAG: MmgE/PrpD family protein [Betaproteobacteria bacterium]|nr:MAG: MmgE/PrpD family protein [Betaproteobacteria bacterium]
MTAGADPKVNHTAEIAARVVRLRFEDLDSATIAMVKRLIADGIAVAVAGSRERAPALIAEYAREQGCREQSTVWSFGLRTSPAYAALANAASMHVLDFEPMSSPPTHAVSPTVPVALALAEALGKSGRDVVTACAKGFEMQGRVLAAASHARGSLPFHTPGVVGVTGSTAAASHLHGLDAGQLAHAFGIATSRCAGLSANTGSMVKCTHCGNAAAAGLEAARLAQGGFVAHPNIFDAPRGYVSTFFPEHFDFDTLLGFGKPFRCVDPGMAIKFYPSKYPTHFVITAALGVRSRVGDPRRIRQVRILTPDIDDADRPSPRSGLEGKFSFQYTASAALLDGRVGINSFTDARRFAPDLVDLLGKCTVVRDATLSNDTRNMRVEVQVTLDDGATHAEVCTRPPGSWGQPVDPVQHGDKIRDCLGTCFDTKRIEEILGLLDDLERANAADVGRLIGLLA